MSRWLLRPWSGRGVMMAGNRPVTGSVTIGGTAVQGQTLMASNTLSDADGVGLVSYQWNSNGSPIIGATGSTLLLTLADVGAVITVTASYTDGGGTVESVTSAPVGPVALDVPSLFGPSDLGVLLLPSADTMYQDAAGTTPVTGSLQPAGLVLDQSKRLSRGPELKGGLSSTYYNPATDTYTITRVGASVQSITLSAPAGRYLVTVEVLSGQPVAVRTNNTATEFLAYAGSPATGRVGHTSGEIRINHTADGTTTLRVHTLRLIEGYHAFQASAPAQPRAAIDPVTGAYYLELDGVDDWLQTRAIAWGTDAVTVIALVERVNTAGAVIAEYGANVSTTDGSWYLGNFNTGSFDAFQSRGTIQQSASASPAAPMPRRYIAVGQGRISTDTLSLQINNETPVTQAGDQGSGNYGTHPLNLFARGGTSARFAGRCYALLAINRLLSPQEIDLVKRHFAQRGGLTL